MTSALLAPISTSEAKDQFDLLFDKYLEITVPCQPLLFRNAGEHGVVQLEACGVGEVDEVYADSASLPAQDQAMTEVAQKLAKLGDQYNEKFGGEMKGVTVLTQVFTEVAKLEYSTFETMMQNQVPVDDNYATSFVLVMHITGKVVANVGAAASKAKSYFRRYIQDNYAQACAQAGGMRQFVGQQ